MHKPELYVEPDLGIPLDLLDLSVYKYVTCSLSFSSCSTYELNIIYYFDLVAGLLSPPKGERLPLAPEDEELLRDDNPITPIKKDGIKKKERPTDKGVSWLVKTQYISPLSTESAKQVPADNSVLKEYSSSKSRKTLFN